MGEDNFTDLLKKFTNEELEAELMRREAPDMLASEDINVSHLRSEVACYIQDIKDNAREPKNGKELIFEKALTMFYGKDIFSWINKML